MFNERIISVFFLHLLCKIIKAKHLSILSYSYDNILKITSGTYH